MANPQTHNLSNPEPLWPVNAKWVNGVAPGYWPTNGGGLVLDLSAGTSNNSGTIVSYAGGTLTMADNTTNYVFLDSASSYAPGSNTSGFTSAHVAIATVVTLSGAITAITDHRLAATVGGGGGSGIVTSVALTMPGEFTVSGSPITTSGTLAVTKANESANQVFAGPTTGAAAAPTFRALVAADIPNIAESQVTNLSTDLAALAPLASPALTGTPTAPTAAVGTNTTQIATTAFVIAQQVYDVAVFFPGTQQTASQVFSRIVPPRAVAFAAGLSPSTATAITAATGSTVLSIQKNGSQVGTITFSGGGTSGSFAAASPFSFNGATDVLSIVGPATPDATLADIGIVLSGTR